MSRRLDSYPTLGPSGLRVSPLCPDILTFALGSDAWPRAARSARGRG